MKIICLLIICLSIVFLLPAACAAGCAPLQISLWSPIQLVEKDSVICGVRLDLLMGENAAVYGLDVGLANIAGRLKGLQAGGILNRVKGNVDTRSWGMQIAGITNNDDKAPFTGIQLAGLVNDFDDASFTGVQIAGLMNDNDKASYTGAQIALLSNQNYGSKVTGLQVALFNQAQKFNGLQVGLGNGVSAAEGAVGMVVVPICLLGAILGGKSGSCPLYTDSNAHDGATVDGVQLGIVTNITEDMNGLQVSLFNFAGKSLTGVQIGAANIGFPVVNGTQLSVIGNLASDMTGLQLGAVNGARSVYGFQVGFVNICKNLKGLQVGAINIVTSRFPSSIFFAPIFNLGF
jgi:hypothetical protein